MTDRIRAFLFGAAGLLGLAHVFAALRGGHRWWFWLVDGAVLVACAWAGLSKRRAPAPRE